MNAIPPVPDRMLKFIRKHHLLSLATVSQAKPWCFSCFYAYSEAENLFIFTTDMHTRHAQNFADCKHISGTIALETKLIGMIQGIQLSGEVFLPEGELLDKVRLAYLKKFPFAILAQTPLWAVRPDYMKMTDNKLGFGKKLHWPAQP